MPAIDPLSFFFWKGPRLLIDVRPAPSFLKGSLENARSIPQDQYSSLECLRHEIQILQAGQPLHLVDDDGITAEHLSRGTTIDHLEGGYKSFKIWRDLAFDTGPPLYLLGGYSGSGKTASD